MNEFVMPGKARVDKRQTIFKRLISTGVRVFEAYRKAGYKGGHHAAYQLKSRLEGSHPPLKTKERPATRAKPNSCEVCGRPGIVCWDHNHGTGKFRGWLCHGCNSAIGFAQDCPETLEKLAVYLRVNPGT